MKNHYHLMIQTPNANLDTFMQYFASCLSRSLNKLIGGDGFVEMPSDYILSSDRAYVGLTKKYTWESHDMMLDFFGSIKDIVDYHDGEIAADIERFYEKKRMPSKLSKATI